MPHSGIDGSKPVCGSPSLIAAYHALHRLLAPRHPPCALSSLTIRTRNCHVLTSILKLENSKDCGQPAAISVNTHCECVVGKLPLQSIQLSKSSPSPFRASAREAPEIAGLVNPSPAPPGTREHRGDTAPAFRPAPRSAKRAASKQSGEYRARTGDLLVANQALSQLS